MNAPTPDTRPQRLGALPEAGGTRFRVWAPNSTRVALEIEDNHEASDLTSEDGTYFEGLVGDVGPGARYRYRLDGGPLLPDPASRFQPEGVHGPSEVVDPAAFHWSDSHWQPPAQERLVFYELHVGTFTAEGTFEAARSKLRYLLSLGVTAIELMPVADFPGRWNWGYDHAALYAPSRAYGRPDDLRAFVDEAHLLGMAVFLDVIYNHLGPDGAYLPAFGPVFTDRHRTPWGDAINLDDEGSMGVRDLFIDNALHWLEEYHLDGLRLDATHALVDDSETHFLAELSAHVARLQPRRLLIAEDHRNLNTLLRPRPDGFGLDAVWVDDLHHQVRNITAGDSSGYYKDYVGTTAVNIAETLNKGWFYDGRLSRYSGKPRGTSADDVLPHQCVVCIQNHDQIGNRPSGNRITDDVSLAEYRAASALLLFAPQLPLIFQGQEWAATTPFLFFTDHNERLGPKVSAGRKEEFRDFPEFEGDVPDPQDPDTFVRSRLNWPERASPMHGETLALYREMLSRRRSLPLDCTAEATSEKSLRIDRGSETLLIAFDEVAVPRPVNAHIVLHTEEDPYAPDPLPPIVDETSVYFRRAGAVWLTAGTPEA